MLIKDLKKILQIPNIEEKISQFNNDDFVFIDGNNLVISSIPENQYFQDNEDLINDASIGDLEDALG